MKEAILTKRLDQSSYIMSFQSMLYPAINQAACCLFRRMEAKITWNFVKGVSWKKKKKKEACWHYKGKHRAKNYLKFFEGGFLKKKKKKKKKLADTIKGITVPQFLQKDRKSLTENNLDATKSSLKRLGKAAKKIDITRSGGSPLLSAENTLTFQNVLFYYQDIKLTLKKTIM